MDENRYQFFSHRECEFFPCHEKGDPDNFNCLFCYCPLYMLGPDCGGNYSYTKEGFKDCSACLLPHNPKSYSYITGKYKEIVAAAKKPPELEET